MLDDVHPGALPPKLLLWVYVIEHHKDVSFSFLLPFDYSLVPIEAQGYFFTQKT